ncbi:hypothetical protein AOLI_G00050620 [Acnodon oligacanthus]
MRHKTSHLHNVRTNRRTEDSTDKRGARSLLHKVKYKFSEQLQQLKGCTEDTYMHVLRRTVCKVIACGIS